MSNVVPIEQKMIDFDGAELMAVKANDGKIYVGVKYICEGIGFTEIQARNQRAKINNDYILNMGRLHFTLPTSSGIQEIMCIALDYLPLWLAKISITPAIQQEYPGLVDKLTRYQLKAKDVLAQAFIGTNTLQGVLPQSFPEALRMLADQVEQNQCLQLANGVMAPKAQKFDTFMDGANLQTVTEVAKSLNWGRNNLYAYLRDRKIFMLKSNHNLPYQRFIDAGYFSVKEKPVYIEGRVINKVQTYVTPKGVSYIADLIKDVA
jgi:anti-repressor protein